MVRLKCLLTCVLLVGLPRTLPAQTVLTLDDAIQSALGHNAALRGARAGADETAARAAEAQAQYWPRVSFAESWRRGTDPVFVFGALLASRQFTAADFAIDRLNTPPAQSLHQGTLSVQQRLFDGGRLQATVDAAGLRREMATLTVREAQAGLALAVTRTYTRVLAAQATQASTAAAGAAAEADRARATDRRDAGTATEADVLALSVHLADVRQRTIAATGDAAIARAELNRLMGVPIDRDYAVQEPTLPAPGTAALDLPALLQEAGAARPELARATMAVRLAELTVREAHAAWYPDVDAQAGYSVSGETFSGRASSWIAGANVHWTISTGGAEAASARAATAGVTGARAAYDEARAAVDVEVVTAIRRRESAIARAAVGQAAEREARESQRIMRDRYDAGLATVNDVLRAATAVLDADVQRVSALVDALASDAELQHALGRAVVAPVSR